MVCWPACRLGEKKRFSSLDATSDGNGNSGMRKLIDAICWIAWAIMVALELIPPGSCSVVEISSQVAPAYCLLSGGIWARAKQFGICLFGQVRFGGQLDLSVRSCRQGYWPRLLASPCVVDQMKFCRVSQRLTSYAVPVNSQILIRIVFMLALHCEERERERETI